MGIQVLCVYLFPLTSCNRS